MTTLRHGTLRCWQIHSCASLVHGCAFQRLVRPWRKFVSDVDIEISLLIDGKRSVPLHRLRIVPHKHFHPSLLAVNCLPDSSFRGSSYLHITTPQVLPILDNLWYLMHLCQHYSEFCSYMEKIFSHRLFCECEMVTYLLHTRSLGNLLCPRPGT